MSGDFSEQTKRVLAKRAGEKYSLCTTSTSKPHSSMDTSFINLGEAAHIKGNKPGKHTRFDTAMTDKGRCDISNAIWLCSGYHKQIDSDSITFTVIYLHKLKRKHENKIYLGEFDIKWKEYLLLEQKVKTLELLISEKESNASLQNKLQEIEVIHLRIELEKVTNEKLNFENALENLRNTIADLEIESPTSNTKLILDAYKKGNIQEVKDALSDEKLLTEEIELSKKRLLKTTGCRLQMFTRV